MCAALLPRPRELPLGVRGQLELRDVSQHRPVAGRQAGDPDQRGVGVHGGVGIQGHLLGCKKTKNKLLSSLKRERSEDWALTERLEV